MGCVATACGGGGGGGIFLHWWMVVGPCVLAELVAGWALVVGE